MPNVHSIDSVRLIDATRLHAQVFNDNGGDLSKTENVAQILLRIENAPTVDVKSVKRGKWIIPPVDSNDRVYCSVCGWRPYGDLFTNFCAGCGADMDGDKT